MGGECSATCHGVHRRGRVISVHRKGAGKPCVGSLEEMWPCNPGPNETEPVGCVEGPPVDCVLSPFKVTKPCSATCGAGQLVKTREIATHAQNGGKACSTTLQMTEACSLQLCPVKCQPQNCEWSPWGVWSACDKCGGQKRRQRHIVQNVACNGEPCNLENTEEVTNCTRKCHEPVFCSWDDWEVWSACTATCDEGRRHRTRSLTVKSVKLGPGVTNYEELPEEALEKNLQVLSLRARELEARRMQEIVVAFGAGLVTLVALVAGFRAFSRGSTTTTSNSHTRYGIVSDEVVME